MLVEKVMNVSRAWMIAHDTDVLDESVWQSLMDLAQRRLSGEPMAYIMGCREFMGLAFRVTPDVLIPRPDTEILVEEALSFLKHTQSARQQCLATGIIENDKLQVLDLGTGSGAIAVSIAHYASDTNVWAGDVSAAALKVAQTNAEALKVSVKFAQGEWFAPFADKKFDLIVSNPPYIHKDDVHLQRGDLRFEPSIALTDFADGLTAYRTIVSVAGQYLRPQGALMFEHGWNQAQAVRDMLVHAGFESVHSVCDLAGIERVSMGYWNPNHK